MTTQDSAYEAWHTMWSEQAESLPWRGVQTDAVFRGQFPELVAHFQIPCPGGRVLVPLCGNSPILPFLRKQGMLVVGVEYVRHAIECIFTEHFPEEELSAEEGEGPACFAIPGLRVLQQDYFSFVDPVGFDLIYDRAALIAIDPARRAEYAKVTTDCLKPGGLLYLETLEGAGMTNESPPYSTTAASLESLFSDLRLIAQRSIPVFKELDALKDKGAHEVLKTTSVFARIPEDE